VKGKACHSGTPELGVNAIEALAQRIIRLHQLSEPENGISVTVGMVEGGISPNTVSGEVSATVSWRYERLTDGQRIQHKVEEILTDTYVINEELGLSDTVEMTLDVFLPPMERSDENQKLIDIVIEEAKRLGQNCVPIARGGGSDANHVSASGTPSICGMGVPAQGIHTNQEMIYLPGLYDRIELLASTLYRLVEEKSLG
jgi:glutamate carboxypeptidase